MECLPNEKIDKELLNCLNFKNLKEIVFQNPTDLSQKLYDNYIYREDDLSDFTFRENIKSNIKVNYDIDNFHVPSGFKPEYY